MILAFFIFCIVLFIYMHVQFQLRTSNDLEIYELDEASKDKMEEICDLRQPVVFDFQNDQFAEHTCKNSIIANYPAFEIKVRNVSEDDFIYLPLNMNDAVKLFEEENKIYFSENNEDFLKETGVIKHMQYNDAYLRPYMMMTSSYDVLMGSDGVCTPLRYNINYRNFFVVTQGSIKIKLIPPKSSKYLEPKSDYLNFEFKSKVDPWVVDTQAKYKCLDVTLTVGKAIYIPAYWWYSIKFDKNTSVSNCRYRTYMNNIAIIPNIFMYSLQRHNVKMQVVKTTTETNNQPPPPSPPQSEETTDKKP